MVLISEPSGGAAASISLGGHTFFPCQKQAGRRFGGRAVGGRGCRDGPYAGLGRALPVRNVSPSSRALGPLQREKQSHSPGWKQCNSFRQKTRFHRGKRRPLHCLVKGFLCFLQGTHPLPLRFWLLFLTPLGDNWPLCSRGSSRRLPASLGPRRHAHARPNGLEEPLRKADGSLSRPHALPC